LNKIDNNEVYKFKELVTNIKNNTETSNVQKIQSFYQLCKKYNIEPIVLRLSGIIKNKIKSTGYLITFTNTRIIVSKKDILKNLIDIGYIAGLGPYLYYIVSDKINIDDIRAKDSLIQNAVFNSDSTSEYQINYKDIEKFVFYNGIETKVTNMLGSDVCDNFLFIDTKTNSYKFIIPVKKNGDYEKIFYWLKTCTPITINKSKQ
jgi:hypothetical protein